MRIEFGEHPGEVDVQTDCQWDQSENRGESGQDNRCHTGFAGFHDGIKGRNSHRPEQVGEFDQQDAVSDHNTSQCDDPHTAHDDREFHLEDGKSEKDPDDTEEDLDEDDHRLADRVELQHQDQDDEQHRSHHRPSQEGRGLGLLLLGAGHLDTNLPERKSRAWPFGHPGRPRFRCIRSGHSMRWSLRVLILPLDHAVGIRVLHIRERRYRNIADHTAHVHVPIQDLQVTQHVDVVALIVLVLDDDVVVVIVVLVLRYVGSQYAKIDPFPIA